MHTFCNFPKVVFLTVTGMGIADIGLSYAGSPAGAVGFFFWGGEGKLSFSSGKIGPEKGRKGGVQSQ